MSEERTTMERRSMLKKRSYWHWIGALGAILVPAVVTAALTIPNTFTAGTVIKSADVNANFAAVTTHANGVDTSIAALQTQVNNLQASLPIALAHVSGTTPAVTAVGGVGTTSATVAGTGLPYTITFTGTYPATITPAKIIVQATAESSNYGVVNAIVNSATTTSISMYVYVWKSDVTTSGLTNNPVHVTLSLGK